MIERMRTDAPLFSICIPQYNRTSFLIEGLQSLANQTFRDFEVCISDDCSTDQRESELLAFLQASGLAYVYRKLERNSRYDANLRAAIGLARGRYCLLLGNDDALAAPDTLERLATTLSEFGAPQVVITNYEQFATGKQVRRIAQTALRGTGYRAAVNNFRNFSFVSGLVLDRQAAQKHATSQWDGSEMYQMFLACRILAEGNTLLGVDRVVIRKDIEIPGEHVDSYARKPRLNPCPLIERKIPLVMTGRLVFDAIAPFLDLAEQQWALRRIFEQIFVFTYPFWIVEYRQVQSWKYAAGICLGMRPKNTLESLALEAPRRIRLNTLYIGATVLGLSLPTGLFKKLYPLLYSLAKAA